MPTSSTGILACALPYAPVCALLASLHATPALATVSKYPRPVLVVQANEFNDSRIQTVVVAAITSNVRLAAAPDNVLCGRRDTGLSRASLVNLSQVLTVDKRLLTERVAVWPSRLLRQVEDGLRLVLAL